MLSRLAALAAIFTLSCSAQVRSGLPAVNLGVGEGAPPASECGPTKLPGYIWISTTTGEISVCSVIVTGTGTSYGYRSMAFGPAAVNQPPLVSAGPDQTITLPATASLVGTVSDDGLPVGAAVTQSWSKVSGPGTVTFAQASSLTTTATFSTAGTYVLRLTASDTADVGSDEVTVTVNPVVNQPPIVSAGADQSITLPSTATVTGTATDDGGPPSTTWSKVSGPGSVAFGSTSALSTTVTFGSAGTYVLRLSATDGTLTSTDDVTIVVNAAVISDVPLSGLQLWLKADAGWNATVCTWADQSGNSRNATQSASDSCPRRLDNDINGKPAISFDGTNDQLDFPLDADPYSAMSIVLVSSSADDHASNLDGVEYSALSWGETAFWGYIYVAPFQTTVQYRFGTGEAENRPMYTRGATINTKYSVTTVTKSGTAETLYVDGTSVYTRTAANAGIANVQPVGRLGRGNQYWEGKIIEVLVYDRALTAVEVSDIHNYLEAKYTLSNQPQSNTAPVVSAGSDQTVILPGTAALTGSVSDDGLPSGTTTVAWSKVSGPGTVTFSAPTNVSTTATFSASGTYVLRLTASDTALSSTDDVTVVVNNPTTGGVTIAVGTEPNSVAQANAVGATLIFASGDHRLTTPILPKDGQIFDCAGGAGACKLWGSKTLTGWVSNSGNWYVTGQTQGGNGSQGNGECDATNPRCRYPEDLFFLDGSGNITTRVHAGCLTGCSVPLAAGRWYFDYAADRIYIGDNPSGYTIETSFVPHAFSGSGRNVTIRNLVIRHFSSPAQFGAVGGGYAPVPSNCGSGPAPDGWIIEYNRIRYSHGLGLKFGSAAKVRRNIIEGIGQLGVNDACASGAEVSYNEIFGHGWAGYTIGWEGGATKFWETQNLWVHHNYIHDGRGAGLWTDTDNTGTIYEYNVLKNLTEGAGISHEVSQDCIIRYNTIWKAPTSTTPQNHWLLGGSIQMQSGRNCDVYENTVTVDSNAGSGIVVVDSDRRDGGTASCQSTPCRAVNNRIHDNHIYFVGNVPFPGGGAGATGIATDAQPTSSFWSNNGGNYIYRNHYHMPSPTSDVRFAAKDQWGTFAQFQGWGFETTASCPAGVTPCTAGTVDTASAPAAPGAPF